MNKKRTRRAPSALGSVSQLPSGRWRARYTRDGATFSAPHTFDTKDAAQTWLAGERADRARGTWLDPRLGRETLAEYAHTWLEGRADLAPRTAELYRRLLREQLLPKVGGDRGVELGRLPLAEITPAVVRTWLAAVRNDARDRAAKRAAREATRRRHPARVWAQAQGLDVPLTGRMSPRILEAWQLAGAPDMVTKAPTIQDNTKDHGAALTAHCYQLLRNVLNDAVTDGLIPTNPCQIPGAGNIHAKERRPATPAEVTTIAEHMPEHLAAAVILAAWSGLRFGELFALARKHVDLAAGTVFVERAIVNVPGEGVQFGKPKTHRSRRIVHLPRFVLDTLTTHMQHHVPAHDDALLFTNRAGQPMTTNRLSYAYNKARSMAGLPQLRWHDLRHTGATLAYSTGASMREVQNRLGHSTMRAAAIYAHAADDSDRVLADRLDTLYRNTQHDSDRAVA